nr:hypothetical protein [uncultured Duganella sp.]
MEIEQRFESLKVFRADTRQRLERIEAWLGGEASQMVTKADLALMETRLVKWFTATAFVMTTVMSAIVFATVRFTH